MSCKYCKWPPKDIQVKGGGRYGHAYIYGCVVHVTDRERTMTFRAKYCPMCGERLVEK